MEDENLTTSTPEISGDAVITSSQSEGMTPAPEPSTPAMESGPDTIPATTGEPEYERIGPQPQTEQTLAETYVDDAHRDAYLDKGHGVSDWIKNEYNYNQQEAGTMWVAGKINDVNTQMSFLEATLTEDMYSELDLQKYFFDTNLATARAYAKEKKQETAYGWYRAATEKAIMEGNLIGWYMPAEANYMLSQWAVATEKLKDPNATPADRNRAASVKNTVAGWFDSNNITWRGIECLNSLYLKETIRHNKEMERLQDDANQIAAAQQKAAAAGAQAGYKWQLRTLEFQIGEMEKDMGFDLDLNGVIGHGNISWDGVRTNNGDNFGWYPTQKDWAMNNLTQGFSIWGSNGMKVILGNDYNLGYNSYRANIDNSRLASIVNENGSTTISKDYMNSYGDNTLKLGQKIKCIDPNSGKEKEIKIDATNKQLYIHYMPNGEARLYVFDKNGVAYQITDKNVSVLQGKEYNSLSSILNKQSLTLNMDSSPITVKDKNGNNVNVQIGILVKDAYRASPEMRGKDSFGLKGYKYQDKLFSKSEGMTDKAYESITSLSSKGYELSYGTESTNGSSSPWVMIKKDANGKVVDIKEVGFTDGNITTIKNGETINITVDPETGKMKFSHLNGDSLKNKMQASNVPKYITDVLIHQSEIIGTDKNGDAILRYINPDGSIAYFSMGKNENGFNKNLPHQYSPFANIERDYLQHGIKVMSESEVSKLTGISEEKLNNYQTAVYNYQNGIYEEYSKAPEAKASTTSSEEYAAKLESASNSSVGKFNEDYLKGSWPSATTVYSNSKGSASTTNSGSSSGSKSSKSESTTKKKQVSDSQVVDDINKTEVDIGERAVNETEKRKKNTEAQNAAVLNNA